MVEIVDAVERATVDVLAAPQVAEKVVEEVVAALDPISKA